MLISNVLYGDISAPCSLYGRVTIEFDIRNDKSGLQLSCHSLSNIAIELAMMSWVYNKEKGFIAMLLWSSLTDVC